MVPLNVAHLLASYGYGAVVLFVTLESTGIPFPGETMLLVAAIAAGTTHQLSIGWVIVAAASGAILGDNLGFWIGREAGFRIVRSSGRFVRLDERKLKLGHYLFLKHGGKVVFFGRFVTVLRTWAAFLAGTNQMLWPRFLLFNAALRPRLGKPDGTLRLLARGHHSPADRASRDQRCRPSRTSQPRLAALRASPPMPFGKGGRAGPARSLGCVLEGETRPKTASSASLPHAWAQRARAPARARPKRRGTHDDAGRRDG